MNSSCSIVSNFPFWMATLLIQIYNLGLKMRFCCGLSFFLIFFFFFPASLSSPLKRQILLFMSEFTWTMKKVYDVVWVNIYFFLLFLSLSLFFLFFLAFHLPVQEVLISWNCATWVGFLVISFLGGYVFVICSQIMSVWSGWSYGNKFVILVLQTDYLKPNAITFNFWYLPVFNWYAF